MEEPPAKRTKRTDSAAMWDTNEVHSKKSRLADDEHDPVSSKNRHSGRADRDRPANKDRSYSPRKRSRSRERRDHRRERSRSRERPHRDRDGGRDRDRDRGKDGRDRDRDHDRDRLGRGGRDESRSPGRRVKTSARSERPRRPSRSRSPRRNGTNTSTRLRSPPRGLRSDKDRSKHQVPTSPRPHNPKPDAKATQLDTTPLRNGHTTAEVDGDDDDDDDEDALLRKMMGFNSFKSTQNTKVPGNNIYGVRKEKKSEYRQYMNRTGGFNRPLSPSR